MPGRPFPQASRPPRMQGQGRTGTGQLPQVEPTDEAMSGVSMEDIGSLVKTLIDAQLVAQVVEEARPTPGLGGREARTGPWRRQGPHRAFKRARPTPGLGRGEARTGPWRRRRPHWALEEARPAPGIGGGEARTGPWRRQGPHQALKEARPAPGLGGGEARTGPWRRQGPHRAL
jgi:hypothetical protein